MFKRVTEVLENLARKYELSGEKKLNTEQYRAFICKCDSIVSQVNESVRQLEQSLDELKGKSLKIEQSKRLLLELRISELRESPLYEIHRNFFMIEENEKLPGRAFKCFVERCDSLAYGIVEALETISDLEADIEYLGLGVC